MGVRDKLKELKNEIQDLSSRERAKRSDIVELKRLVEEKKKREESLKNLEQEESALLKELGLE